MEAVVQSFLEGTLAPSTKQTYQQGSWHYFTFCTSHNIADPFPLTTPLLWSFASYLDTMHLSPHSIKTYLAAVKHEHTLRGHDSLDHPSALKLVERGIARHYCSSCQCQVPITPPILRGIKALWFPAQYEHNTIMLWAALCTGFFEFFRIGEITFPTIKKYDPGIHLTFDDITIDNHH